MKFKRTQIRYKGRDTYGSDRNIIIEGSSKEYSTGGGSSTGGYSTKAASEGETAANNAVNAYSLQSFETKTNDTAGHWNTNVWYVNALYDGLTLAIRNTTPCYQNGEGYNTLNVNGLGAKLVWKDYDIALDGELATYSEIIVVYREDAGLYYIPNPNTGELVSDVFPANGTVSSGWIIIGVTGEGGSSDLRNYYTKQQTDAVIQNALINYYTKQQTDIVIQSALTSYTKAIYLTQSQYDAISNPDNFTFYRTTDTSKLYFGNLLINGGVTPPPVEEYIVISTDSTSVPAAQNNKSISVSSNTDWEFEIQY